MAMSTALSVCRAMFLSLPNFVCAAARPSRRRLSCARSAWDAHLHFHKNTTHMMQDTVVQRYHKLVVDVFDAADTNKYTVCVGIL